MSVRTNVDWKINNIFTVGTSSYANYIKRNPTKGVLDVDQRRAFPHCADTAPVDADGNFLPTPFYLNGPNLYGNEMTYHQKNDDYGFDILAYLDVKFIPELTLHVNGAAKNRHIGIARILGGFRLPRRQRGRISRVACGKLQRAYLQRHPDI